MRDLITVLSFVLLIVSFILIAEALRSGLNAVSIGGMRVLFKRLAGLSPEAGSHMRRSLICQFAATSCLSFDAFVLNIPP